MRKSRFRAKINAAYLTTNEQLLPVMLSDILEKRLEEEPSFLMESVIPGTKENKVLRRMLSTVMTQKLSLRGLTFRFSHKKLGKNLFPKETEFIKGCVIP